MKRAYHYTSWRFNNKKEFCGVNFGYDFSAEHESGISTIRDNFGIVQHANVISKLKRVFNKDKPELGIDARIIKKKPLQLTLKQKGDFCCIYFSDKINITDYIFEEGIRTLAWEMSKPNGNDLSAFWGEDSFMLVTTNQPHYQALKKAFNELDIAIFLNGRNGLVIAIPSKLDDSTKTEIYANDFNAWELNAAAEKTGIRKRLKSAKMEYLALQPNWKNPATKELHFWLNPTDQRKYKAGWYSVDDLDRWIKNEGPVVNANVKNEKKEIKFGKDYKL